MNFALKFPIGGAPPPSGPLRPDPPLRPSPSREPIGKQNIQFCSLQNPKVGQLFVEIIYPWKTEIFANYWENFLLNINFLQVSIENEIMFLAEHTTRRSSKR